MDERERIAAAVKQACIDTALRAYEEAGISGLCAEGRWELAVDTMRNLDTKTLLASVEARD
ncbi:MAG: acetyltransferase [Gammaproteobacteria bacterium]|nr:acetyltransferase [Gammaproteobacteria bacterium]MCW8841723.1 acetyltransferase [Gammaproteobacteria bacterium]MCW8927512.1 acetyltransferase [Gammaproteobacteria bacterium]MCW8959613.1 acetyltransferase [Gammaproteobacteria bacterium]MCW8973901.1 acetyltransferase [Gammaproteobacteria bacterium]